MVVRRGRDDVVAGRDEFTNRLLNFLLHVLNIECAADYAFVEALYVH